jgi:hypothetical protein
MTKKLWYPEEAWIRKRLGIVPAAGVRKRAAYSA